MTSTMMHKPMSVKMLMEHGARVFPDSAIATFDGERITRTAYRDVAARAAQLAQALQQLGVQPGDRVATYCWNSQAHMEAYLAIPSMAAILHTVNIRLSAAQAAWVINHAEDKVVIVDSRLAEPFAEILPLLNTVQQVIVVGDTSRAFDTVTVSDYDTLIAPHATDFDWPELEETSAAAICYTSGTTGNPKGVVYSHRTIFVHSLASRATDTFGINERDRILLLPPMFHANAWGLPYSGWMSGSDILMPGPFLQPDGVETMIRLEQPTFTAMVPTILNDVLRASETGDIGLASFRMIVSGGSAVAPALIDTVREKWGVPVLQGWGMTETSPLCALSHPPRDPGERGETYWRAKSGRPVPGVQVRVMDDKGAALPHDGAAVGELQLCGPWITGAYYGVETPDAFTADGWLRTGDVGHIDERGFVQLTDRTKDVIKSGGEWISSVDLENCLLAHDNVVEAAVIAVADPRWQERPMAIIVSNRENLSVDDLQQFLSGSVARFWIPEYWCFVDSIPKTSVGKIDKKRLRQQNESGAFAVITNNSKP